MPEIKFVGARLTHFTMAPQETKAVKRLHCEADFTAKVARWLGVKEPGEWPDGWGSISLAADDKTVTVADFEPSDSARTERSSRLGRRRTTGKSSLLSTGRALDVK